jgi:ABC-type lipoprotein export system ATPase subunit
MEENYNQILQSDVKMVSEKHPLAMKFFSDYGLDFENFEGSIEQRINQISRDGFDDLGISKERLLQNFEAFMQTMTHSFEDKQTIDSITILPGKNKLGESETINIILHSGSITSIVGPTGSGKSRLLADIEWLAQGDTPTGRTILINGETPDPALRFSLEHKLVAQLSQNMNFVMDASVGEFIAMHAESRMVNNVGKLVTDIIAQANLLAGESFTAETALTSLSGGQSRALMIADTAMLSTSPVVLIDEIENAGIDRKKALQLLVKNEKIILIATHDPILALMAEQRMVIKNGGIHKLIVTSINEKANLENLERLDAKIQKLRNSLRMGEVIEEVE